MRGRRVIGELEVLAKHAEEMFLQAHGEGVNPAIENHVRALIAHLRGIARGKVLNMDGGRNDGATNA